MVTRERVPHALPLQPTPESDQVTPRFKKSLVTVAVKTCVPYPAGREVDVGETLTEIGATAPLIERKAARPAPQMSDAPSETPADTVPEVLCN